MYVYLCTLSYSDNFQDSEALSRAETFACKSEPSIVPFPSKPNTNVLTCSLEDKKWSNGNHIMYGVYKDGNSHVLKIETLIANLCEPKPEKCHCKTLVEKVLELNIQTDRIDGYMKADPFIAGCNCYLGAAARAGFRFVEDCDDASAGRIEFTKNDYGQICESLEKAGKCEGKTKIYKK